VSQETKIGTKNMDGFYCWVYPGVSEPCLLVPMLLCGV